MDRPEKRSSRWCQSGWSWFQECLPPSLLIFYLIIGALVVCTVIFAILWLDSPPPRSIEAGTVSSDENLVFLRATSWRDVLEVQQPTTFSGYVNFQDVSAQNITAASTTSNFISITNQTSGVVYDLDTAIENIIAAEDTLDFTLGMPELQIYLATYYNETIALMRKRNLQRRPNLVTFLYDTQNNVTNLQNSQPALNQSLYANVNYAFYPGASTVIPASPSNSLVNLVAVGPFAQQVGVSLVSNQITVTKAGLYDISFNVAVNQPASAIEQTLLLMVDSSTLATSNINWSGGSTGICSFPGGTISVSLTTSNVIQLIVSASASGSTVAAAGTNLSIRNVS